METREKLQEQQGGAEQLEQPEEAGQLDSPAKKRWFGRGIYGSKDVPIRLLDGLIAFLVAAIIILTTIFAVTGGFVVTFDSLGGSEIADQKVRHSDVVEEPEIPIKPGYVFDGWYYDGVRWNFTVDKVGGDIVLTAGWIPAEMIVKFDLDGGTVSGNSEVEPVTVTYQEPYGELPVPEKEGYQFEGWVYSGAIITGDTLVSMTGEHVLTASWK